MRTSIFRLSGLAGCSLLLAIPMAAANKAPEKTARKAELAVHSRRSGWAPETVTGKIMTVDPARNLLIIQTSDNVPFDMVVKRTTKIDQGARALTLEQMRADTNKTVSVRFIPERSGDIARVIRIQG